jgi:hypothetical protein
MNSSSKLQASVSTHRIVINQTALAAILQRLFYSFRALRYVLSICTEGVILFRKMHHALDVCPPTLESWTPARRNFTTRMLSVRDHGAADIQPGSGQCGVAAIMKFSANISSGGPIRSRRDFH